MLLLVMRFVRRMPFTIVMIGLLIVVGILTESHFDLLELAVRRAYGSSLETTLDGKLLRVFSSLFLTAGGWRFYASVAMLAGSAGWVEWEHGTWQSMMVFFGVHIVTLAFIYFFCILPFATMKIAFAESLVDVRDVGPSAGYYGCLGFALARVMLWWKWPVGLSIYAVLAIRLIMSVLALDEPHLVMGDVAHLVALPLGACFASVLSSKPRLGHTEHTND